MINIIYVSIVNFQAIIVPVSVNERNVIFHLKNINGFKVFQDINLGNKEILLKNYLLIQGKINLTFGLSRPHLF